jgi:hypothetical protein
MLAFLAVSLLARGQTAGDTERCHFINRLALSSRRFDRADPAGAM